MAGIFQGDMIIKTAIELGIEDMRENPWLIDHMFEDLKSNPYLRQKYGQKQIDACKEWFANNKIEFYMSLRKDKEKTPYISIGMGPSPEKKEMKTMADQSTVALDYMPGQVGKPIPYIVKPFIPTSYNSATGEVDWPANTPNTRTVVVGQILVNPDNGEGYVITGITPSGVTIEPGLEINATKFGIVPQFQIYRARVEHTFFQESYNITCHAHGDMQNLLWLWSITLYSLLRYRESLLEYSGFTESEFSNGDPIPDENYSEAGETEVYKRTITITGQVENTWVKSPRRFIESAVLQEKTKSGVTGGIKILSNENTPSVIDPANEIWYTVNENEPIPKKKRGDEDDEE